MGSPITGGELQMWGLFASSLSVAGLGYKAILAFLAARAAGASVGIATAKVLIEHGDEILEAAEGYVLPFGSPKGRISSGKPCPVDEKRIRAALKNSPLKTVQGSISQPAVERYVRRLEDGEIAPPIKIDQGVIVDGNHRYAAGRVVGAEPEQIAGYLPQSQVDLAKLIENIHIDPTDWGNH